MHIQLVHFSGHQLSCHFTDVIFGVTIQNFHLGRYIVGYKVENLVLMPHVICHSCIFYSYSFSLIMIMFITNA